MNTAPGCVMFNLNWQITFSAFATTVLAAGTEILLDSYPVPELLINPLKGLISSKSYLKAKRADFVCVLLGDGGLLLCSGGVFFLVSSRSVSW
jgi:hypothetical protein